MPPAATRRAAAARAASPRVLLVTRAVRSYAPLPLPPPHPTAAMLDAVHTLNYARFRANVATHLGSCRLKRRLLWGFIATAISFVLLQEMVHEDRVALLLKDNISQSLRSASTNLGTPKTSSLY
eukprot:COSAG01_NODE_34627_length_544_cov_1.914607_1_plen_123_part_10